jgi:cytochrome c-type biogenesis protein CcmH
LLLCLALALTAALALRQQRAAPAEEPLLVTPQMQREFLIRHLERRPRDGRGWAVFAMQEFEADRFESAAQAFERAVAASPRVAADPSIWCEWADALGMAQGGSLAGRPTDLIHRALALRASHPKALEMAGSAAYERRDFALAASYWRRLLPQLDAGSKPHAEVAVAIERAERLAATSLR